MDTILKVTEMSKSFGGVRALTKVSFELKKGKTLAVCGENGAGKSTLMKCIVGAVQPDQGTIKLDGEPITTKNVADSTKAGISIVFQEPNVFPDLSVLENMYFGVEIKTKLGICDWKKMNDQASLALKKVKLDPGILKENIGQLSIGTQQLVLIAKGINTNSRILILDEPTSILSQSESEQLFKIMSELKEQGISILYISHRIAEILEQADDILVLRDGCVTQSIKASEATEDILITSMSGRSVNTSIYRERKISADVPVLELKNLSLHQKYKNVNLQVNAGEILGIYGLVGAGRSEVAWTIFGHLHADSGEILYKGKHVCFKTSQEAINQKVFYLPEDRGTEGIFNLRTIRENMTSPFMDMFSKKLGILDQKKERSIVDKQVKDYKIKIASQEDLITSLSGGNQQKVVFCRWLLKEPSLLILDEPTRGIDIGTKVEMHKYIMDLAEKGVAIVVISSDLQEVMAVSDRIITMELGRVTKEIPRSKMSEEIILKYALGGVEEA